MNKKLGIILMFIGAYVILLGGLFWNMLAPSELPVGSPFKLHNDYDWFWGFSAAIVVACGAALSIRKNFLSLIGSGICILGVGYCIGILVVGTTVEGYFSEWIFIGAIVALLGAIISIVFYFIELKRIKEYGPIML